MPLWYALYIKLDGTEWQRFGEFEVTDAVDALVKAARTMLPDHHDLPIALCPADRPGPQALDTRAAGAGALSG